MNCFYMSKRAIEMRKFESHTKRTLSGPGGGAGPGGHGASSQGFGPGGTAGPAAVIVTSLRLA